MRQSAKVRWQHIGSAEAGEHFTCSDACAGTRRAFRLPPPRLHVLIHLIFNVVPVARSPEAGHLSSADASGESLDFSPAHLFTAVLQKKPIAIAPEHDVALMKGFQGRAMTDRDDRRRRQFCHDKLVER